MITSKRMWHRNATWYSGRFNTTLSCTWSLSWYCLHFTFIHLVDAFIQSDLQMRTIEAVKLTVGQQQVLWPLFVLQK